MPDRSESLFRRARCKGWFTLPDHNDRRSCGKVGTRAVLFPHWHGRDLGNPLITARQ